MLVLGCAWFLLLALAVGCSDGTETRADSAAPTPDAATPTADAAPPLDRCNSPNATLDGEGCAIVVGPASFVSGTTARFTIEFTVGPSGIPIGGGISVGIHHASEMWPQTSYPTAASYTTLDSASRDAVSIESMNPAPTTMFVQGKQSEVFHKVVIARPQTRALEPGERIQFTFGANARGMVIPRSSDDEQPLRVTTDVNGDGVFDRLREQPHLQIRNAPAIRASATAPSQLEVGVPFEVMVTVEDAFMNVAEDYDGFAKLRDEHGQVLTSHLPIMNGIGRAMVAIGSVGPHRIRIETTNGQLSGRSNPLRVFATLPEARLYFGELHGHTSVSDGLGDNATEYFRFGRDVADLDFVALTDHAHFDWPANVQAVQEFYAPGEYVTILAQEAGTLHDHMNIYFRDDDAAHIQGWAHSYPEFMEMVLAQWDWSSHEAMTGPHHFAYDFVDDAYPFGVWDERVARFVEVYSAHGTSEFPGNPRPLVLPSEDESHYMQYGLSIGLKFGVIAASDNHDSKPGRTAWGAYPGGLAGVWANELTRAAIWESLWSYRVYGTSADRIYLEYSLNGSAMGSTISTTDGAHIRAYVIGKTDVLTLTVIRDNYEIHAVDTTSGVIDLTLDDVPPPGEHFYYLRVTEDNGERAWSTPIWVTQQ